MNIYSYKLALHQPNPLNLSHRAGILIEWDKDHWGEIAPLEGWSSFTFQQLVSELPRMTFSQIKKRFPFSYESAFLPPSQSKVHLAGLLYGTLDEMLSQAKSYKEQGFETLKLKVAQLSYQETLKLIEKLKKNFRLRIDPNQSWTLKRALKISQHLEDIDYIEEPFSQLQDSLAFAQKTGIPLAFDETPHNHPDFLQVVKPSANPHILPTSNNVLSSSFETGVGISNIIRWALHTQNSYPIGIDTYRFLKENVLSSPLDLSTNPLFWKEKKLKISKEKLCLICSVPSEDPR